MLLPWVLSTVALLSAVHGSRGFDVSPSCETSSSIPHIKDRALSLMYLTKLQRMYAPSPVTHPKGSASHSPIVSPPKVGEMPPTMQAVISSAQPSNPSSHVSVEHKWPRLISPSIESQTPNVPLGAAHDLSPSHMNPPLAQITKGMPVGGVHVKAPISASPVALPNVPGPATSPNTSPINFLSAPSPVISPAPHEVTNTSNTTHAPLPSQPGSSPMISPMVHEVKNPSNATHAPLTSLRSTSPVMSPVSHKVENPFKTTHAPLTSHLVPSPAISPMSHEVKNHSNITNAPSTTHPAPSPAISPMPDEVKNHSNITHAPSTTHPAPSPVISPIPHEVKNHSNITNAPSTTHPAPSPAISPMPHEAKNHSNITHAPSTTHPAPSPAISPMPHEVKNHSNITLAPSTTHPAPSPVISPSTHDVKNPSNTTHAPSTSHPAPSPVISPSTHDGKNTSNTTHPPSTSTAAPSPVISPAPHNVKNSSNATQATSTSQPAPSPMISPAPHDVKNPSNATQAPATSHPAPSPMISPAPHDVKNPSNSTQPPSSPHPAPHVISPAPHDVKNPPNATHASSTSHPAPSPHDVRNPPNATQVPLSSHLAPPVISPAPPDVKNSSNTTQGPLTSHPAPSPVISPAPHESKNPSKTVRAPLSSHHGSSPAISPSLLHSPASAPAISNHQHAAKKSVGNPASAPFSVMPPSSYHQVEGPVISPAPLQPPVLPKDRRTRHAPPFYVEGPSPSPIPAPFSSTDEGGPTSTSSTTHKQNRWPIPSPILSPSGSFLRKPRTPSPQPVRAFPPPPNLGPIDSPMISPSGSSSRKPRTPPPHVWVLPPPPPNSDCNSLTCSQPLTNAPPGAPCACVLPIKVKLRLGVALYTFFPLVSELAQEIAAGIFMKQSQVRIMGANAANDEPEKTIVLIDLVPLGRYFDSTTAFLIYQRFWHKQVAIQASYFGDYDVLYVLYPGLPPSPPTAPADLNVDDGAYGNNNNARTIHPLGVDVTKRKEKLSGSLIAIIVLSSVIAMLLIIGSAWFLVLKRRVHARLPPPTSQTLLPTFAKSLVAGTRPMIFGSGPSSTSSSIATYTGSAKTFSLVEIERATNRFDDSRIIGEGGFGRVYQGTLEDGTRVAVKVLKRDDQQGGREFLAEVEMLSRLHHRNLVKLIGICTEDVRCLVYELIPNGSVESHLHGVNKETAPLDWSARVKIALGAARGLAYLHEDSSPCVIHRDFKSSNILLEHDFTPKVSDFGLARTAVDEGNEHISTRVMGTFGYVAPEYAMTGHLLVKSDVYSYGVVLLELLTGRKPVDMSQPPGQENLVTWARPLLTSLDGLETIIDPALGVDVSFDSVAKVAAIASMCVQPEVSHRPFMGEVVQALKLVCNESDEHNRASGSCSQDELPAPDTDMRISMGLGLEAERALSASDIFSTSARFTVEASRSSRRQSSSGPLTAGGSRQSWRRVRDLSGGSMSEHGFALRFGTGLDGHERWP